MQANNKIMNVLKIAEFLNEDLVKILQLNSLKFSQCVYQRNHYFIFSKERIPVPYLLYKLGT